MSLLRTLLLLPMLACLSACFISDDLLIEDGITLSERPVVICTPDSPPCFPAIPEGEDYIVTPTGEPPVRMRFKPIAGEFGAPVFLGAYEMKADEGAGWQYILVRASGTNDDGAATFDLALPGCGDARDGDFAAYGLVRSDQYSCTVTDIVLFEAYLLARHGADFADPAWWTSRD